MRTPREILLQQHQAASPKLDALRAEVVAGIARAPGPETVTWRDMARSMRWHLAALSAAWVLVMILNIDHSPSAVAMMAREKIPPPRQIWASLRENRRLLLEYSDGQVVEKAGVPGRRSEVESKQAVV